MSVISFLVQGTKHPLLQEMKLDNQLSSVTITRGEDRRTIEQIKINDTYLNCSHHQHSILARSNDSLISIDYSCIDRAEQIWCNFHRHILYALSATAAVLPGLVTLHLSSVVKTRYIVLAQLAVACFFMIVLARADEIYRNKPLFPGTYGGYTSVIDQFRKEVIKDELICLGNAKTQLPYALRERAAEFFTENEIKLLGIVKSSSQI